MTSTLLSPTNVPVNFSLPILIRQSWREASTSSYSRSDDDDGDDDPGNVGIIVIFPSEKLSLHLSPRYSFATQAQLDAISNISLASP